MTVYELLIVMGVPGAVTGLIVWWLKKDIDKKEKKREEREKNTEKLMLLIMQSSRANTVLVTATAKAVQRIPDAKCNGDMKAALEEADRIQKEEKDFLFNQGVEHIFGNN